MAQFVLTITNNTGAAVTGSHIGVPPTWIQNLSTPIANNAQGTVEVSVPDPAPGAPTLPVTALVRYTQGAQGMWQLLMTNPGPGGVPPNASGSYVPAPSPAGRATTLAAAPCPANAPAGAVCYNVTLT